MNPVQAMDVLEQDYHNFSTSSSHRLPTLSGTQAIRNARRNAQPIPTCLASLDKILGKASTFNTSSITGGVQRGLVTEIFGPPGVGKTTFALQVAVNALYASANGTSVTWIDTSSQLVPSRLTQLTDAYRLPPGHDPSSSPPLPQGSKDAVLVDRFNYLQITSLPRLLALFLHPNANFPLPNTSVIVLDDLSNLILSSLPRSSRGFSTKIPQKTPSSIQDVALSKRALSRRFQVVSSFALSLQRFAAATNVAVLVTSKATVNLKAGQRAVLRPALTSQQWDNCLAVRIALYRDFWPEEALATQKSDNAEIHGPMELERRSLRLAKVTRLGGKLVSSPEVGFVIEEGGLREVTLNFNDPEIPVLPLATQPVHHLEDALGSGMHEDDEFADDAGGPEAATGAETPDPSLLEAPGKSKRKAIEIADSEDESNDTDGSGDGLSLPPAALQSNGFQRSSQVYQDGEQIKREVSFSTAKKLRADIESSQDVQDVQDDQVSIERTRTGPDKGEGVNQQEERGEDDDDNEMLLEKYDNGVTSFSQAAADSSEPLTPSGDERDLS